MADANYTTPITLDAETQRAIVYALIVQANELGRIRCALEHLDDGPTGIDGVEDIVLYGAQAAEDCASNVREWLAYTLFGTPDPDTVHAPANATILAVFKKLACDAPAAAVVRAIEGDTNEDRAA